MIRLLVPNTKLRKTFSSPFAKYGKAKVNNNQKIPMMITEPLLKGAAKMLPLGTSAPLPNILIQDQVIKFGKLIEAKVKTVVITPIIIKKDHK